MASRDKKYVADNEKLMAEWNWKKNNELGLNPEELTCGSSKRAWWVCSDGHEWEAKISNRSILNRGCPYCAGSKVLVGYNDLATVNPELAKQWHPTKNESLTPLDFTSGSGKKVWWVCDNGHEWEAEITRRNNGNGCPYCSGREATVGYNDLATVNPELAKQWHPTKNSNLKPQDVTSNSSKMVWWICDKGHEWEANVAVRNRGNGCPYCANYKVLSGYNDLATVNVELAKQWNYHKNGSLKPRDVVCGSHKKVWWICDKGHEWEAQIKSRNIGANCPYCDNHKVLTGYNDLATTNPELSKEWHPSKNGTLTPKDVTAGSGKKVWWICYKGHEWNAVISSRSNGCGCPYCDKERKTSFSEQAIYFYCKKVTIAINRYVELGKEIDIYLPEYKIGIEYNGCHWHKDKEQCDYDKIKYFSNKGIRIITVKESEINFVEGDVIEHDYHNRNTLNFVIKTIFDLIGIDYEEPDVNRDEYKIYEQYINIEKENSIAIKCPKSIKEWNYEKNGSFLPTMVTYGSGKKVWFKCEKCGHEWQSTVVNYAKNRGCPECSKKTKAIKRGKAVRCIETGVVYYSQGEASRKTGIHQTKISSVCIGKRKTAGGYHWEFVEE